MSGKKIILENSKQPAMMDGMGQAGLNEKHSPGWEAHVTVCTSHPLLIKYPEVSQGMPTALGREYCQFLWISAIVNDKAAIHRISGRNVKLYAMEFIVMICSQEMNATIEKKFEIFRLENPNH